MSEPLEAQDEPKLRPLRKIAFGRDALKRAPTFPYTAPRTNRIGGALGHLASRSAEIKGGGGLVVPAFVAVGQRPLVDFARLEDRFA